MMDLPSFFLIFFIFGLIFFSLNFFFIQLQLSAFSPHPSTPPQPIPPPSPTSTLPLDFVLVAFIVAPVDPSPYYPRPTSFRIIINISPEKQPFVCSKCHKE